MSKIEWTERSWNPILGCSIVSPGCTNCYAMRTAHRLGRNPATPDYDGLTRLVNGKPVWTGEMRLAAHDVLTAPLRRRTPTTWFVNSMSDLFAEGVQDAWLDQIFAVMALTPQHTYQVLTKRPERMRAYINQAVGRIADGIIAMRRERGDTDMTVVPLAHIRPGHSWWPLPNVWLGVSTEDQTRADERIPILLDTPAAVRWISAEPLLGAIDGRRWMPAKRKAFRPGGEEFLADHYYMTTCEHCGWTGSSELCGFDSYGDDADVICPACHRSIAGDDGGPSLDWVVAGGESGPGARPMHPDWARQLRDHCAAAGVPFFFKQWGEWAPRDAWVPGPAIQRAIMRDGSPVPEDAVPQDVGGWRFERVGKKAADRHLDGVIHDAMPGRP